MARKKVTEEPDTFPTRQVPHDGEDGGGYMFQPEIDLAAMAGPSPVGPIESSTDNGEQLVAELTKADKETEISNARAMVFENANKPKEKTIDKRMANLVSRTFLPMDWGKVLDRFEQWMALGDQRTEERFIRKAHEEGPEILGLVQDVYIQVKFAREAWELDNYTMLGAMREEASNILEGEKAKKLRTKTITIDDVTSKAASLFPDEYAAQEKQRRQYSLAEDRAKFAVERATIRCKHLDTMLHKLR